MFANLDSLSEFLAIVFPWLIIVFIWWKYFKVYALLTGVTDKHPDVLKSDKDKEGKETTQTWFKPWGDPQNLWNALRGATTAVLEMAAIVAISEFVFLLAVSSKVTGESATTFFGMVTGFLLASAANRAPKIKVPKA